MAKFLNLLLCLMNMLCIGHAGSSDTDEKTENVRKQSVEDFKRVCPFTDMCFSPALDNISRLGINEYPCCYPCMCDSKCGTACCPDKPDRFLNEIEALEMKTATDQCVYAQIRPYSLNHQNGKPYSMVANCPSGYTNKNISDKCSREYHDFNFGKDDVEKLVPVSSETLNVTFKNYHCAVCHDALETTLHFWNTKVECKNQKKLLISNISELYVKLWAEPMCKVIFEPSLTTPLHAVKYCSNIIERCNVTAKWENYDFSLESACLSYTSEYRGFKNIHCFLCNGHIPSDIDSVCYHEDGHIGGDSFVALLDFNNLERPSLENIGTKCSLNSKYDQLKGVCRPLICSTGMILSQDRCIPLFKEMILPDPTAVFRLRLNLIPTKVSRRYGWTHLLNLAYSVLSELKIKQNLWQTAYIGDICAVRVYVKLGYSLENTEIMMKDGNLSDFMTFVSYLAIVADFSFVGIRNISATLEEMAMIYTMNNYFAQYEIQYPSNNNPVPQVKYNFSEQFPNILDQSDPSLHEIILGGKNDPDDGLGILWLVHEYLGPAERCEPILSILPNPFCARIEVSHNEFNIDINKGRLSNIGTVGSTFNLFVSKIFPSKNVESVQVCADEYFKEIANLFSQQQHSSHLTADNHLVLLTIICLVCSILSLLLTFIVYCLLPSLRTLPGLNSMALVFHLFLAHMLALVIAITDIKLQWLCSAVCMALHFTLLSSFFWMFICTFHMAIVFKNIKERITTVHPKRKFVYYFIFTELISGILVASKIVVTVVSGDNLTGLGYGGSSCYLRDSNMILYFVAVPLGIVLVANLSMFAFVIWRVSRLPDMAKNNKHNRQNTVIFAKLSTLTGITWLFGFLYQFTNALFFAYAYIVLNAGQGVFIMAAFVMNKRVYAKLCAQRREESSGYTEGTTRSVHFSANPGNVTDQNTSTVFNVSDTKL